MVVSIAVIVVLLFVAALFSGSETAFTSASRAFMLDQEKNENNKRAKTINKLFSKKEFIIITTLLGYNLSIILATALTSSLLINRFGNIGIAYTTAIMTFVVLVYAEMFPKNFALKKANQSALVAAPFLSLVSKLLYPLTYIIQKSASLTFKIFGLSKIKNSNNNTALSEIRGAIHLYNSQDCCQEKEMLKSVLDLADVEVYDVMNHRKNIFAINADMPIEKIIEKVINSPFSRVPVYKDRPENIVGIFRVRELLQCAFEHKDDISSVKLEDIMTKPWFIPDNTTLKQQLQLFRARREHFAFVVDEYGAFQGIVTLEDILEEIVGDINDELDIQSIDIMGIKKVDEKSLLVDGQVPIRDLNRKYGWELEDENAVTIAGYLLDMTQSIPEQGQKFNFNGFEFEVTKRSKNQLASIKITPPAT